jgi:hypothetical protein
VIYSVYWITGLARVKLIIPDNSYHGQVRVKFFVFIILFVMRNTLHIQRTMLPE